MAERGYPAALAERVAEAVAGIHEVTVHHGFERIELSHRDETTLGFVEPSGLWLDDEGGGELHPGRFGRRFRRVAGADDRERFAGAIAAALERSERGETYAALPVMEVSSGLYLGLMNGDAESLAEIARAVERTSKRSALWRLWEPRNWRPHMLACAAACVAGDASAIDMAWTAFDRFSWAAPQLAVTLARVDPGFAAAAAARLEAAPESDDVWPRPLDRYYLDGKSRGALAAMLGRDAAPADEQGAQLAARWKQAVASFLDGR